MLEVSWQGFEELENSKEKFSDFFAQVPVLVLEFLEELNVEDPENVASLLKKHRKLIMTEVSKRKLSFSFLDR